MPYFRTISVGTLVLGLTLSGLLPSTAPNVAAQSSPVVGEHRVSGEREYYLSNLPPGTKLKRLASLIKARWGVRAGAPTAEGRTRAGSLSRGGGGCTGMRC